MRHRGLRSRIALHSHTRTQTALLNGLLETSDEAAWGEFDARYRPIILAVGRQLGLSAADAEDVAQETLRQFVSDYRAGRYDRQRGRLRSWLVGIARHRIADHYRARGRRRERRGESAMHRLPARDEMESIWNAQCRRAILGEAVEALGRGTNLSAQTIEAFRRCVIDDQGADHVAREMGIPRRSVYLAKHRCLAKLREIIAEISIAYEVA